MLLEEIQIQKDEGFSAQAFYCKDLNPWDGKLK